MESKRLIMLLMFVGSIVGGYVPLIWGGSTFSFSSVLLAGVGGFTGIYAGYKLSR